MTPHISAKKGEIAKVVLMPGDPLRAKWIAENFLEDPKLVSFVRNMYCYTGKYKNHEISVMGHGMGLGSIGIYSFELFKFYDVDTIIRVGSCGSYCENVNVGDVVLVKSSYTESPYAKLIGLNDTNVIESPSKQLDEKIKNTANKLNINLNYVACHSSDVFYRDEDYVTVRNKTNSDVVEMESFALFANAIKLNKQAATLLTCSDSFVTEQSMSAIDRQQTFSKMIELALESTLK